MKTLKKEKSLKNVDLKYVLTPFDQEKILSGAAGCNCDCIVGSSWLVAGSLTVDGFEQPFYYARPGDIIIIYE